MYNVVIIHGGVYHRTHSLDMPNIAKCQYHHVFLELQDPHVDISTLRSLPSRDNAAPRARAGQKESSRIIPLFPAGGASCYWIYLLSRTGMSCIGP